MKSQSLTRVNTALKWICGTTVVACSFAVNAVPWPNKPLATNAAATPMTMLIAGKDHRLFYEAYNDASDIDGDGTMDTRFKPEITYFGLYDSSLCYSFSGTRSRELAGNDGLFSPAAIAGALGICTSTAAEWSGNWLNYVTTSRIDALRKVLYGGFREVDSVTETILRRSYIPQDAHSWAKEYTSTAVDKYNIADYTPYTQPAANRRHLFASLTYNAGVNCQILDNCSNLPPLLSVAESSDKRVWGWASEESSSLLRDNTSGSSTPVQHHAVRVRVCTGGYLNGCKQYPNGQYKPTGLLHEYGEQDAMLFGLITGTYDRNITGGVLRKRVSTFKDEVNATTGQFASKAPGWTGVSIVHTFDKLRIRDFNNNRTNNQYEGLETDNPLPLTWRRYPDWGNPIAEMMYEGMRYFAGKGTATTSYVDATAPVDTAVFGNANRDTWDDPYASTSKANAAWCAKANFLTISDINVSYDSDNLPGVYSGFGSGIGTDLTGLRVVDEAAAITAVESTITGKRFFIGQSEGTSDAAPTPKIVNSLGTIRGISPEEPTKQGSYYSAALAYYAKRVDLRPNFPGLGVVLSDPSDPRKKQTIDMYKVALASPLPTIAAKLPNGKIITVVPFGKTVATGTGATVKSSTAFAPTHTIVDFYVDTIANSGPGDIDSAVNGGRYYAKFRINFEDVEQGNDHDMDLIGEYTIIANADDTLTIRVTPVFEGAGYIMNIGYVLSGSSKDGVYLVAQNDPYTQSYFLNTPRTSAVDDTSLLPGNASSVSDTTWLQPGACDVNPNARCSQQLAVVNKDGRTGYFSDTRRFSPSASANASATFLKDPLWFAAKWGGFQDRNSNGMPDLESEWDSDGNGVPDTYFLVQNPLQLQASLKRAFDSIISRSGGGGNVIANSRSLNTETLIFQGVFDTLRWSGNLLAYPVTAATGVGEPKWNAAQKMPIPADRKIFFSTSSGNGAELPSGAVPAALTSHISSLDLLRYLRGDPARELAQGGPFRDRATTTTLPGKAPSDLGNAARLGDITHSSPVYVKDTETVYIGANDGMLHAFSATTGAEQFAFVPSVMLPRLKNLASLGYNEKHEFFVDGDIAVSSRTQTTGKNHLVAALGRGGKGLFGLDVTNVGATGFLPGDIKWEYFNPTDLDLGYMLGRPIIAQMNFDIAGVNKGIWAVIVGNGYESSSGLAALYIFDLANGTLLRKITMPTAGSGNGLATPGTYDSNNDGKVDVVYAGDLKGNVWKFDVGALVPNNWNLSNNGRAIYQARDAGGKAQPITAPLTAAKNTVVGDANEGQVHVFFGTGTYFRNEDPNNKDPQTWYSIVDRAPVSPANFIELLRSNMFKGGISNTGTFAGMTVRSFLTNPVAPLTDPLPPTIRGQDGCLIDLPESGERMVTASNLVRLLEPTLFGSSIIPKIDQCEPGGTGYVNAINPFTCARLSKPLFDINNNNNFTDDVLSGNLIGSINLGVGMPGELIIVGRIGSVGGSDGRLGSIKLPGNIRPKGRISWREIVRD